MFGVGARKECSSDVCRIRRTKGEVLVVGRFRGIKRMSTRGRYRRSWRFIIDRDEFVFVGRSRFVRLLRGRLRRCRKWRYISAPACSFRRDPRCLLKGKMVPAGSVGFVVRCASRVGFVPRLLVPICYIISPFICGRPRPRRVST